MAEQKKLKDDLARVKAEELFKAREEAKTLEVVKKSPMTE